MSDRRFRLAVLAAAVTGVGLRVIYVLAEGRRQFSTGGDATIYHLLGKLLARGEGYIRPMEFFFLGDRVHTAEFPPLWPMLLAGLDLIGLDSAVEHRLVGALIGGVSIIVMAMLGEAVGGRHVGAVVAAVVAVYPQWIVFDVSLLSEGLYLLLVSTVLLGVFRARRQQGRASRRWWLLVSVALGLAVMTRTESIALAPLLIVPSTRHVDRRIWIRTLSVALAGTLVVSMAWTVRNAVSLGHPQPFTNNSGTLIAGSNCAEVYSGFRIGLWWFDCVPKIQFQHSDEVEGAALQRDTGLNYASDHLSELPKVAAIRVARTFGAWDIRTQLFFESFEGRDYDWLWAGWLMWIALVPFALAGAVFRRRNSDDVWLLLIPVAIAALTAAVSYGNQRFRVIAEPSVVLLAAIGAVAFTRAIGGALASRRDSHHPTHVPGGSS